MVLYSILCYTLCPSQTALMSDELATNRAVTPQMSGRHITGLTVAHTGDRGCGPLSPCSLQEWSCLHASHVTQAGARGSSTWTSTHPTAGQVLGSWPPSGTGTICALERTELPPLDCRKQGAAGPSHRARGVPNSGLSEPGTWALDGGMGGNSGRPEWTAEPCLHAQGGGP